MRNSWKRTSAFLLAFTLVAAPLNINQGIFKGGTGIVAHAEEELTFTYTLYDDATDTWNGNAINVYAIVDSTEIFIDSITMGADDNEKGSVDGSIVLEDGVKYKFVWSQGEYSEECGFTINDENGYTIITKNIDECDSIEDESVLLEFTAGTTSPKIANASVTLADAMGLNFYVDNITSADGYTVKLEGKCLEDGQEIALTQKDGKFFVTATVYAKDVNEEIKATLYKDGAIFGQSLSYSVADYLTAASTALTDEKDLALVAATQAFGAAAADYFYSEDHGFTAAYNNALTTSNTTDDQIIAAAKQDEFALAAENAKVSLVLNAKTAVRLYVKDFAADQLAEGSDAKSKASSSDKAESGFPSYFEVIDLLPQKYDQTYNIKIDGTEYKFSAMTWANRVLNNTDSSTKNVNMAKAATAFYLAAKNYVAE